MLPSNPIEIMDVYASKSQYINGPSPEQQAAGTVPLDTLPADWWNWLWRQITERINQASEGMEAIYDEVMSVLTAASIEPSQLQSDQLLNAIKALVRVTGTAAIAGAVKSSTDSGKVSIDENGIMTVNNLGIPSSLNTTVKNIVGAINEILLNYTNNKATTDAAITGLQNSKAPNNHASGETTYGVGTASTYGHVKLYDGIDSDSGSNSGVAATPAAVKALNTSLQGVCTALNSKLSTTGCAADSAKLGGTAKGGLFTNLSASGQTISATIGGVTKSATIAVPSAASCVACAGMTYNVGFRNGRISDIAAVVCSSSSSTYWRFRGNYLYSFKWDDRTTGLVCFAQTGATINEHNCPIIYICLV